MRLIFRNPRPDSVELAKRLYLPGVVIEDHCPECRALFTRDLGNEYLKSYAETEKPIEVTAWCPCGHEWTAGSVVLHVTIEIAEDKQPTCTATDACEDTP